MKHRRKYNEPKLPKDKCEICGLAESGAIELHHIIPRTDPRCSNLNANLTPLCGSCPGRPYLNTWQIKKTANW